MDTILREAEFGLNNFQRPKRLQDEEALCRTVLLILFGRPGCFPTLPEVGMNISQYFYKFSDEIEPTDLKVQLAYQCSLVNELIETGELEITKVEYDGRMALRFIIPSLGHDSENILVIGVTTNYDGSVIYNYDMMKAEFAEFF